MTTATINKVLFHACPRCRGDLFYDVDHGEYSCLQCGGRLASARIHALATIDDLLAREMSRNNRRLHIVPAQASEASDDAA